MSPLRADPVFRLAGPDAVILPDAVKLTLAGYGTPGADGTRLSDDPRTGREPEVRIVVAGGAECLTMPCRRLSEHVPSFLSFLGPYDAF